MEMKELRSIAKDVQKINLHKKTGEVILGTLLESEQVIKHVVSSGNRRYVDFEKWIMEVNAEQTTEILLSDHMSYYTQPLSPQEKTELKLALEKMTYTKKHAQVLMENEAYKRVKGFEIVEGDDEDEDDEDDDENDYENDSKNFYMGIKKIKR